MWIGRRLSSKRIRANGGNRQSISCLRARSTVAPSPPLARPRLVNGAPSASPATGAPLVAPAPTSHAVATTGAAAAVSTADRARYAPVAVRASCASASSAAERAASSADSSRPAALCTAGSRPDEHGATAPANPAGAGAPSASTAVGGAPVDATAHNDVSSHSLEPDATTPDPIAAALWGSSTDIDAAGHPSTQPATTNPSATSIVEAALPSDHAVKPTSRAATPTTASPWAVTAGSAPTGRGVSAAAARHPPNFPWAIRWNPTDDEASGPHSTRCHRLPTLAECGV
mmetsp:Transcript_6750/g.20440  ORF Transcript_6750/g.20440 Transcript_6750/m.20440 type:complete len:287 (+) Transcript_6750:505-1365(+)